MVKPRSPLVIACILLWTLLPCAALWVGLYVIKSALWTYGLYHLVCLIPGIIWGRSLWQPTFTAPSKRDFILLLASALLFSVLAVIGYELFGHKLLANENVPVLLRQQGISRGLYLFSGIYITIVNPLLEELFWRGVIFNELDKIKWPCKHFGLIWSSCAYALFHYLILRLVLFPGWAELGTLLLAIYGALLAVLYRRTGSIVVPVLAHGLQTDLACVVLLIDYSRRFGMP